MGLEEHIRTDYGDEFVHKTPWEIYNAHHAENALTLAKNSYELAKELVAELTTEDFEGVEETEEEGEES